MRRTDLVHQLCRDDGQCREHESPYRGSYIVTLQGPKGELQCWHHAHDPNGRDASIEVEKHIEIFEIDLPILWFLDHVPA